MTGKILGAQQGTFWAAQQTGGRPKASCHMPPTFPSASRFRFPSVKSNIVQACFYYCSYLYLNVVRGGVSLLYLTEFFHSWDLCCKYLFLNITLHRQCSVYWIRLSAVAYLSQYTCYILILTGAVCEFWQDITITDVVHSLGMTTCDHNTGSCQMLSMNISVWPIWHGHKINIDVLSPFSQVSNSLVPSVLLLLAQRGLL